MQGSIRRDPVSHRWVTFAPEKAPVLIRSSSEHEAAPDTMCPFCPGNEEATPREILRFSNFPHLNARWSLRVFPARNPLLRIEADPRPRGKGVYDTMQRLGAHEVIVETARHGGRFDEMGAEEVRDILLAWRDRAADLQGDRRFKYLLIGKNRGHEAGGTVNHHYSEIIAFPFVPAFVEWRFGHAADYYAFRRRCVFCDIVAQEMEEKERIVEENDEFLAFCPYASRFPFEVWILPKRHLLHFSDTPHETILPLARIYRSVMGLLGRALGDPAYNVVVYNGPSSYDDFSKNPLLFFHWHLEIIPRIFGMNAVSLGGGGYVNPTLPEEAAAFLRKAGDLTA